MKTYLKPKNEVVNIQEKQVICSSYVVPKDRRCDLYCKYWRICRDREIGKSCSDKEIV